MLYRTAYQRRPRLRLLPSATLPVVVALTFPQPATTMARPAGDETGVPDTPVAEVFPSATGQQTVRVTIPVGPYRITNSKEGDEVSVEGFGNLLVPGKPKLPSRIFAIAIPPGGEVADIDFEPGDAVVLPGAYDVPPAPLPRVIGREDPLVYEQERRRYDQNHASVYGQDDVYPRNIVEFVRPAGYRKYNLVDVRVTPFAYRPQSGRLIYYPRATVRVSYTAPRECGTAIADHLERTEQTARDIVFNYEPAQGWYPRESRTNRGLHDFVIITLDSLTSSVVPLVDWATVKGRTAEVVTTTQISSDYTGYDLAEKIRNFLRDKYPSEQWGIEDVLLVGHYDDVPMRRTAQNVGYGRPETDFYYAELSLPDSDSWDADGDHQYGEDSDPIDFYTEVNVGRIPWSDATTVLSICEKSVAYEQNADPAFKQNMLLLGAYFWPDTDNAVLMEAKVDQPWMADWTFTRMYEKNANYWSSYECDYPLLHSNVMAVWPAGQYAFVNWAGHGSPTSTHIYGLGAPAFITSSDSYSLNDDFPAIIFADACSNSDTDYLNIGQQMLKQGAVGFVGATQVALGCPGWSNPYHGSSQSLDYFFTTNVTSGNYTLGGAHQRALWEMYINGLWDYVKYETFQWGALWGDPTLSMNAPPILNISFPDGVPQYLAPGVSSTLTIEITDGMENYIPGTGRLYYRFDGGEFHMFPLIALGGNSFEASLPAADCESTPEFYVSAESDGGSTVTSPYGAPSRVHAPGVGTLAAVIDDTFETDLGWTAANLGAITGDWQRGVPVNDPDWAPDPISDSDGSGQCFLTQNEMGNTDVDNGAVRLISPTIDMSGGAVEISYDYYLYLGNGDGVDRLLVEIDGNDGAGPWIEIAGYASDGGLGWRHDAIDQADLEAAGVTFTSTMRVRFTANDADPQSVVESGVDAFLVAAFVCLPPAIPPVAEPGPSCGTASDCADEYAGADCVAGTCYIPKNRYLSIDPTTNTDPVAYQVELTEAADYPTAEGRAWWVDEPLCYDYPNGDVVVPTPATCAGVERFGWVSKLTSTPVTRVWTETPLNISDCGIAPAVVYEIRASADDGASLSTQSLVIGTAHNPDGETQSWGDITGGPVEGRPGLWLPPERATNFADVGNAIRTFENRTEDTGCPPRIWVDVENNQVVNMGDVSFIVMAFEGRAYADIDLDLIGIHPADCP